MKKLLMIPLIASMFAVSGVNADSSKQADVYNPFEEMRKMQQEMDQIFQKFHERMMKEDIFSTFPSSFPATPAMDLKDNGDSYLLKMDIPGSEKNEINITTKDGVLTVEAKSKKEESDKSKGFIKHERFEGVYMRSMTLPQDADGDKLESDYKNGVLTITIPKKKK